MLRSLPRRGLVQGLAASLGVAASLGLVACAGTEARHSHGVAKIPSWEPLLPVTEGPTILDVERGFEVETFARGLDLPSALAFDDKGNAWVLEAGGFLGLNGARTPPRLVKLSPSGERTAVPFKGSPVVFPATGIVWHAGGLFVTHRDLDHTGVVSRVEPDGTVTPIVRGLPSRGDHGTHQLAVGSDGKLYFAQGSATSAGVVGLDDFLACGWPEVYPQVRDVPAHDLILTGQNFLTGDPRGAEPGKTTITGAFEPFGQASTKGEKVAGDVRCNGAILRCDPDGHGLEVFAWGLGDPYGVAVHPDGRVLVTRHGMDLRGSRPIAGDPDVLLRATKDTWYGWPDFSSDLRPLLDASEHAPPTTLGLPPEPVVDLAKSDVATPGHDDLVARLPAHAGACGLCCVPEGSGELGGCVVVAEMGPLATAREHGGVFPGVAVVAIEPSGRRRVLVDNEEDGPASRQGALGRGLERPVDVKLGPDGALYVVDMGVVSFRLDRSAGLQVLEREGTGTIYRIWPRGVSRPLAPGKP